MDYLTDPVNIGIALAVIAIIIFAYFAYKYAAEPAPITDPSVPPAIVEVPPVALGHFQWNPATTSTTSVGDGVAAGSAGGVPLYVAAARAPNGTIALGKTDGTHIWYYYDGKEIHVPVASGWILPKSAVAGAVWSTTLGRGVALNSSPAQFICRAATANGVHPGYFFDGKCNISYDGNLLTSSTFEYLSL